MAVGMAPGVANEVLNAMIRGDATTILTAITGSFIELHIGDPGAAGTANRASAGSGIVRKAITAAVAAGGAITNSAVITWTAGEVDTSEDFTHVSIWDAVSSGTFLGSGPMTANAVVAGNEFVIPANDLDLTIPVAA